MTEPRLSVVVPARNAARFLAEALASLRTAGFVDEIVVVDDASEDATVALADALADRVLRFPARRGAGAARNAGLAVASGDWLGFLDADDLWERFPDGRDPRLLRLRAEPELPGCLGPLRLLRDGVLEPRPLRVLSLGTLVVRRAVVDRVGGFDESLEQSEDFDWFLRAQEIGIGFGWVDEPVYRYRRHDANTTADARLQQHYFRVALRRSILRRRATSTGR